MAVVYGIPPFSATYPRNLQLWYDASDSLTLHSITGGGSPSVLNGNVARWEDKSGYNRHLLQSNSTLQPKLSGSMQNNLNGVYFDSDSVAGNNVYTVNGLQQMTIVSVIRPDPILDNTSFMYQGSLGWSEIGGWGIVGQKVLDQRVNFRFGTGQGNNDNYYTRTATLSGAATITITDKNQTIDRLFINGSLISTRTGKLPTIANTSSTFQIGFVEDSYWKGIVLEVLVYSNCLSDVERNNVFTYLNNKWRVY